MSDFENRREERRRMRQEWKEKFRERRPYMMAGIHMKGGNVWTGIFILLIGVVALLKAALVPLPYWVFSWPMILIALGFFIAIRHGFRGISWLILILIGGAFLADHIYPDVDMRRYTWPMVLIVVGLFFILRPKRRWHGEAGEKKSTADSGFPNDPIINPETTDSGEDYVNATSVFGGTKKNILSKNFKGGDIVNIFGGTELYLSQADISGTAVLEMTTIFGGTKLIIPSNWTVRSQAVVIFGGIEDKRAIPAIAGGPEKVLLIKGTVIFGGVDIKSF